MRERKSILSLDKLGDLVAIVGGVVSAAYLSGYVNRWAYLREFGAQWLLPQVSTASIVMASFFGMAALYVLIAWSFARFVRPASETALKRLLESFIALDVMLFLASVSYRWPELARAALAYASALVSLLAVVTCAHMVRRSITRRTAVIPPVVIGLFLGFIVAPVQLGQGEAWWHVSNGYHGMGSVAFTSSAVPRPLLLATSERLYCIEDRSPRFYVRAVEWEDVVHIRRIESYR